MLSSYLLLCLSVYQDPVDKPSIRFFQDNFIVRVSDKRAVVPLQLPKAKPTLSVSFRKNKNYAVWDDRGLTIRIGKVAKSSRLEAIATSPRAFTHLELLDVVQAIQKKERKTAATALSGARRIGNLVFFLARWEDSKGVPWLEALVSVDLTEDTFHPKFLARLNGLTLADKPIDDRLFVLNERMSAVVRKGNEWGLSSFDGDANSFEFRKLGDGLRTFQPITSRLGAYVERTEYGTSIGGRIDLANGNRKNLVEERGPVKFADLADPLIAITNRGGNMRLINTETGAVLDLISSASMRRSPLGLVVWSPLQAPKRAWLYSLDRWQLLAEWQKE
jgi:hypothetical protein